MSSIRDLIQKADPDIVEDRKWAKPTNPDGVPAWSHDGIVCTGEIYKDKVKLTFFEGAALADPSGLFNASLDAGTRRAIDLVEGDELDPKAFMALIRAAVTHNEAKAASQEALNRRKCPRPCSGEPVPCPAAKGAGAMAVDLEVVPEAQRSTVAAALDRGVRVQRATSSAVVTGGASGALTYRVEAADGSFLLRVETIRGPLRNPHQYDCMQAAAEVGVAPPIRFVDGDAGVLVMPFIEPRPLTDHPGGPAGAADEVAGMLARLHATEPFPARATTLATSGS